MIESDIPQAIVQQLLLPSGVVATKAMPPGMSGAIVYRCQLGSGDRLALKRWPDGTTSQRIKEVHRAVHQSRISGLSVVPALHASRQRSYVTHQNSHWDLMDWLPGRPAAKDAGLGQVRAGAETIAKFHASVRGLGECRQVAPAVVARLKRLDELTANELKPTQVSTRSSYTPELNDAVQAASQLIHWKWPDVRARITRSLSQYVDQNVRTQYVLRDVHREHVLFIDHRPSGIIDFDSIRVDTPATDLARWVGSFLGGDESTENLWNAAVAGFRDERALNDRRELSFTVNMAKDLCFATIWISLANWSQWLLKERRTFPPGHEMVATRIRELVASAPL